MKSIEPRLFLGLSDDNFAIFDGKLSSTFELNPICHKFYSSEETSDETPDKTLLIDPDIIDPITFDSIKNGDTVVLINDDKRYMLSLDSYNKIKNYNKNPFTNQYITNVCKYIVNIKE